MNKQKDKFLKYPLSPSAFFQFRICQSDLKHLIRILKIIGKTAENNRCKTTFAKILNNND